MRWIILSLWLAMLGVFLGARAPTPDKTEEAAIQRAKNVLVSSLDSGLPKVSLEFFLNYESGGAPIRWELHDCRERTGSTSADRGSSSGLCVQADFERDQTAVTVLVSVGTSNKGLSGIPMLVGVTVDGPSGRSVPLRRLGDLPKELHRPVRGMPRDSPTPITASSEFPVAAPNACSRPA
jgi:hypothetical protein